MSEPERSAEAFIASIASTLGVDPPSPAEIETLLDAAGIAAHASERKAAPIVCWLIGSAGVSADEAITLARRIADEAT